MRSTAGEAVNASGPGDPARGTPPASSPPPFGVLRRAGLLRAGECVAALDATVPSGGGVAPHLHEFYEVALIVEGRGQHLNGSLLEPLRPGDVLLLHPATPHGFLVPGPEPLLVRNILFTEAAVGGWLPGPAPLLGPFFRAGGGAPLLRSGAAPWTDGEDPERLGARMVAEYRDRRPGYQSMLQGYLRLLLTAVWRTWSARNPEGPGDDPAWWRLVPVLQRMVQDAGTGGPGPRLEELAAVAGWSGPHLSRVFRRVFGRSVQRYLRELRVQRAATLLLTSGEPVEAVAAAAGYSDARALRRAFAASYHRTPREYRDGRWGQEPEPAADGRGPDTEVAGRDAPAVGAGRGRPAPADGAP